MEGGSSLGTYVAYALIVLFLLVLGFVVARSIAFYSLLFIAPLHAAWRWVTGRGAEGAVPADEAGVSDTQRREPSAESGKPGA